MAGSTQQIEQEIAALEDLIGEVAKELKQIYGNYLKALGRAVRHQLVLAVYHLCTQGYPKAFLKLPFSQRQKFQTELRQLARNAQDELEVLIDLSLAAHAQKSRNENRLSESDHAVSNSSSSSKPGNSDQANSEQANSEQSNSDQTNSETTQPIPIELESINQYNLEPILQDELDSSSTKSDQILEQASTERVTTEQVETEQSNAERIEIEEMLLEADILEEFIELEELPPTEPDTREDQPNLPERLNIWQEGFDQAITQILRTLSRETNFLLRNFGVLPRHIPEKVLKAASKTEASETLAGSPNLLNLMIETENRDQSQTAKLTRLMIIHLRLSEIEFADASVMTERNQIRALMNKLGKIKREYQKKLQERTVLEAEAAWRSSWFEDGAH